MDHNFFDTQYIKWVTTSLTYSIITRGLWIGGLTSGFVVWGIVWDYQLWLYRIMYIKMIGFYWLYTLISLGHESLCTNWSLRKINNFNKYLTQLNENNDYQYKDIQLGDRQRLSCYIDFHLGWPPTNNCERSVHVVQEYYRI